ncbi:MAG: cache domain-containing protein [Deltaproteobacteria bacterium]|nr:cache domain-containing protein [Deltaproteobacteria bacterium]
MTAKGKFFSLKWKLTLANVLLPILTMTLATVFAIHTINGFISRQAQNKIINDLNSAHEIYYSSLKCLKEKINRGATSYSLIKGLIENDPATLKRELQNLRENEQLTFLTLTDSSGQVIMRAGNPEFKNDRPNLPLLAGALIGSPGVSTETLTISELNQENHNLKHLVDIELISTPRARKTELTHLEGGMLMLAAWPIHDARGNIIGALYGGKLLNRNNNMVDKIKKVIFSTAAFSGQDIGTVTIFQDDVRIATNVLDSSGNRALGTRVSKEVYDKVVINRQQWNDRAFVVNNWYISAYEPIYNAREKVIGILYVGMQEKPFNAFRNSVTATLLLILGVGAVLTFMVVFFYAYGFSRRLSNLKDELKKVSIGHFKTEVKIQSNDELSRLALSFNEMIKALHERDASIEQLHRELENKVAQRTTELETRNRELTEMKHHLLEMMGDKKAINYRLEESLQHLQQAQQQLVRSGKLAALGSLVAGVAHEINNPVNIISGNLELLEMDPAIRQRFATEIELITTQTGRIKKIIGNMLGFARVRQTTLKEIDINLIINQIITPLRPQLEDLQISLETRLLAQTTLVSEEESLSQIITNLFCNSIQAMPDGGHITITTREEQGCVEIILSDSGCGMTPEQVENMFNPFYSTKAEGTGLGLSIGYELLRSLGGDINVDSTPNQGTTITINLPANPLFLFSNK